jgi:Ca-dependent carbohydrate-binding module xylan-binding
VTADDGQAQTTEALTLTVDDTGGGGGGTLIVRAGGNGSVSAPPQFEVFANGVSLGIASILNPKTTVGFNVNDDSLFQDYVFQFTGASPTDVDIDFFNDGTTDGVNRDLVVDYINVDGTVYESEIDGFFTPDNGNMSLGGPREKLFVNGVLAFDELDQLVA